MMDTLYYSNFCKHSEKVLHFIARSDLAASLNCICVDRRTRTPANQWVVVTETGASVPLPPNVTGVPTLICVRKNHTAVLGDAIIAYLSAEPPRAMRAPEPDAGPRAAMLAAHGEPLGTYVPQYGGRSNVSSEKYTLYSLTPAELAGNCTAERDTYHYMPAHGNAAPIQTPDDTYVSDKVGNAVTVDTLQQQRMSEIRR
jgi:hypothetical protein